MPDTVLALMAHPDDAEILCGGTLALLAERGWVIHIATMTPGDCGSSTMGPDEIAAVRRREAEAAARVIGASWRSLEFRDLRIRYEDATLAATTGLLRELDPAIVITHSPADYMLDHEETSRVARAAAFASPIPNAPAPAGPPPTGRVPHLYYADPLEGKDSLGMRAEPGLLVDISRVIETKLLMLAEHASQREWLRSHHGMDEYLESVRRWGRARGRLARREYAEGFRQHLGHAYPQDDRLAATLRAEAVLHLRQRRRKSP